jgi:DNA-binding response OmpR family regulator
MTTSKRLLIVDDESAILFAFSQYLKSPSLVIETAETVEIAFGLIDRLPFDAAVVDLCLAGTASLDGLSVVRRLKERSPDCIVMVVTAFAGEDIKETISQSGADLHFEKPVSPEKIRETLELRGIG